MLTPGTKAPAFTLPNAQGAPVSLADHLGSIVVLFFYPKDNTPGCTSEACDFRDNFARLTAAGAVVLGVSADGAASHQKFATKYDLPYDLLTDATHEVMERYGVWRAKSLYGRTFLGINRMTFIIDRTGTIAHVYEKVKVKGHVDAVLEKIAAIA
jgi:thioredoxin-dependent peroxiredoxin